MAQVPWRWARRLRALADLSSDPADELVELGNINRDKGGRWSSKGGEAVIDGPSDALHSAANGEKVDIAREDVREMLSRAVTFSGAVDLTDIHVDGMLIFGGNGLGISRSKMPQVPKEHRAQFLKVFNLAACESYSRTTP